MFIKSLILDSTNKNTQWTKIYTLFYVRREHKKFDRKKYKNKEVRKTRSSFNNKNHAKLSVLIYRWFFIANLN
jgi:hypothetical protein